MDLLSEAREQTTPRWILVYPRVLLGWMWLSAGRAKLGGDAPWSMLPTVDSSLADSYGWYRVFVESVVLPNAGLFELLVAWGELLVGVSLILGAAARLGAAGAVFLPLNYALLQGRNPLRFSGWDSVYMWLGVIMLLGAAGRCLGVDQWLRARWPRVPLW